MSAALSMNRPDLKDVAAQVKRSATDPKSVKAALGLGVGKDLKANVRCPVHHGVSLSITKGSGGVKVKCFGCDFSGDVLHLVAAVSGLDVRKDFAAVVIEAAERFGLHHLADEAREATKGKGSYTPRARPLPRVEPPPTVEAEERTYPPVESVEALLAQCGDVADDDEARSMLEGRGLNPYLVDDYGLARVLPKNAALPSWATFQRASWTRTGHRLIVPVYDAQGIVRSVRAWRVIEGETPKRLPPSGHKAAGLIMADHGGRAILTGHQTGAMPIVVCEGEPDWMTWALALSDANETPWATFGVLSGAWTEEIAARIPSGSEVNVWTDQDSAGDKYVRAVASTLAKRCKVVRQ